MVLRAANSSPPDHSIGTDASLSPGCVKFVVVLHDERGEGIGPADPRVNRRPAPTFSERTVAMRPMELYGDPCA